jgi:hypothetical protein
MIEIEFAMEDVARTRFAISPLWEVVASVRVLKGADAHGLHRTWADQVRPRLAAAGLDLSPLFDLVPMLVRSPWAGRIPGFICPPPTTPLPSLEIELATVRAMPPALLHTTAEVPEARMAALRGNPAVELARLADAIEAYWELALAPYWSRILTLLEATSATAPAAWSPAARSTCSPTSTRRSTGLRAPCTWNTAPCAERVGSTARACCWCPPPLSGHASSPCSTNRGSPRCAIRPVPSARSGTPGPRPSPTPWRGCWAAPARWS